MAKKQTKADKAFIAKIGTIGISTGSGKKKCPDCGEEMHQIGALAGEVNGELISGPVYGHAVKPPGTRRRGTRPVEATNEQSFSA